MRIIAGILLYLIVVMLITTRIWCDDNNDELDIEMNFLNAFLIANLTILTTSGICAVCLVLLKIIIKGTI